MAKGFGVSPITNGAIAAVYEWFMGNMDGNEEYSITFPSTEFELVMRRKKSIGKSTNTKYCCADCVYENIDDTSDTINICVSCNRMNDCAKNDWYTTK